MKILMSLKIMVIILSAILDMAKKNLASALVELNLLAFSSHHADDMVGCLWQLARAASPTWINLFNNMSTLANYMIFPDCASLMRMIDTGEPPP